MKFQVILLRMHQVMAQKLGHSRHISQILVKKTHNFAKRYQNGLEIYIVANNILINIVVKFQVILLRMHQVMAQKLATGRQLRCERPTPHLGHKWVQFGSLQRFCSNFLYIFGCKISRGIRIC